MAETDNSSAKTPFKPVLHGRGAEPASPTLHPESAAPERAAPEAAAPEPPPARETLAGEASAIDRLKGMTQRMKSITQEIPAQAILHRTGIIATQAAVSESQEQAAKAKTMRISLADAIGVAPTTGEAAARPMKTIRIKRPVDLPRSAGATAAEAAPEPTLTQRRTLRIARPQASSKLPRPGLARPVQNAAAEARTEENVPEIADIPETPVADLASERVQADVPSSIAVLSLIVQIAACAIMGFVAWLLYSTPAV